jgi:hypothetical protein
MVITSRNWFAMQGPVAIILISWNVIFIWETGYWTRAIKRFASKVPAVIITIFKYRNKIGKNLSKQYHIQWSKCHTLIKIYFDIFLDFFIFIHFHYNVIFIWETGYWTRAIKRFALFDILKSLYSDTKILSKYIPSIYICRKDYKRWIFRFSYSENV